MWPRIKQSNSDEALLAHLSSFYDWLNDEWFGYDCVPQLKIAIRNMLRQINDELAQGSVNNTKTEWKDSNTRYGLYPSVVGLMCECIACIALERHGHMVRLAVEDKKIQLFEKIDLYLKKPEWKDWYSAQVKKTLIGEGGEFKIYQKKLSGSADRMILVDMSQGIVFVCDREALKTHCERLAREAGSWDGLVTTLDAVENSLGRHYHRIQLEY